MGARQVGKTWLMRDFGKRNFARVHEFNFVQHEGESVPVEVKAGEDKRASTFNIPLYLAERFAACLVR